MAACKTAEYYAPADMAKMNKLQIYQCLATKTILTTIGSHNDA